MIKNNKKSVNKGDPSEGDETLEAAISLKLAGY